jgi:UDP-2,3-diacylglucosamine pyrophosphatase LpxH
VSLVTSPGRRWIICSDAHLDTGPDRRDGAGALAQFLDHLVAGDTGGLRVVLLGDVFELLRPARRDEAAGLARLDAVLAANASFVAALRRCLGAGVPVDLVVGNHDIDLLRPAVAARLRDHVGAGHHLLHVRPWVYHVPGVLYAEHGNQHHDLNRFPDVFEPFSRRRPAEMHVPPLATDGPTSGSSLRRTAGIMTGLASTWWADRRWTTLAARRGLEAWARAAAFDPDLAVGLQRAARVRFPVTAPRLARLAARRALRRPAGEPDAYLVHAAERVRRTCVRHGARYPVYVFGHSHIARQLTLGDGRSRYLNCGTWSSHLHAGDPALDDPGLFPYVEIERSGDRIGTAVRWWRRPAPSHPLPIELLQARRLTCALD